jgi:magnesium transporter
MVSPSDGSRHPSPVTGDPGASPPSTDHRRDIKHTLAHIRELLRKQEVIQSLVHRQQGSRQELVESLVLRQQEVELAQKLRALHPAEIAHLLESLPGDQRLRL